MDTKRISHLGIAVKSIEEQIGFFKDFMGLEFTGDEVVADQKVKVAFLTIGESRVELLEAISDDSPVAKFLAKKGVSQALHHVAYEVADLEGALEEARQAGIRLIDETPRIGAGGVRIAFLHPKATGGILTELCEKH